MKSSNKQNTAVKKRLNFKKATEHSSDEDEDASISSGTSKFEVLPGSTPSQDAQDPECIFCSEKFSHDTEGQLWVMCLMCNLWAHTECAGAEKDVYICDYCR